jgi:hypothetical protein
MVGWLFQLLSAIIIIFCFLIGSNHYLFSIILIIIFFTMLWLKRGIIIDLYFNFRNLKWSVIILFLIMIIFIASNYLIAYIVGEYRLTLTALGNTPGNEDDILNVSSKIDFFESFKGKLLILNFLIFLLLITILLQIKKLSSKKQKKKDNYRANK